MATVFKRPTSSFWFAVYRDRNGKQIRKSTKLTDKGAALKISIEWEGVEKMAKEGTAATFQFQQVVNRVSNEMIGETVPSPSIQAYLSEWLEGVKRRSSPATHERYKHAVTLFVKSLGKAAEQSVRGVSPMHIERYLSIAFNRAQKFGFIQQNPVPAVSLPKAIGTEREVFTMEEIEKLVAAAPNLDWQTLILLGFYLGARLGDCVNMTWDNVDADKGVIVYAQKKTGKLVAVPVHTRLLRHLHHVSESFADGPLCPKLANRTPGGKHGLSEGFKRVVVRSGLDLKVVKGKGIRNMSRRTFHSLRHSFASALANLGVSQEIRMKLTGHSSSDIHQKYTHLAIAPLKEAIDTLPVMGLGEDTRTFTRVG